MGVGRCGGGGFLIVWTGTCVFFVPPVVLWNWF